VPFVPFIPFAFVFVEEEETEENDPVADGLSGDGLGDVVRANEGGGGRVISVLRRV